MNKMNTPQLIKQLREKQSQLPLCWVPFGNEKSIFLQEILRDLNARRATFLSEYQGQKSIVKLFYDKQGVRHACREVRGLQLLQQCGIATSRVVQYTVLDEGVLLILSYLDNTKTVASCWNSWDDNDKIVQLSSLLKVLIKMYQKGVWHNDLHLDNILMDENQLYIIDGMDVKRWRKKGPLPSRACLNNLADFFVQLSLADQNLLWTILTEDENAKKIFSSNKRWMKKLENKIAQKSLYRQRKIKSKAWRNCSSFTLGMLGNYQYVVCADKKESFETMFSHLKQQEKGYFKYFKKGKANTVLHYQCDESNWVVKQYSARSYWQWVKHCFKGTNAASSWENANRLQSLHILTAKPVGVLQKKIGGLPCRGYFVMEYVPGKTLSNYLYSFLDLKKQQEMIAKVVQVMMAMKQNHLCHRDLKPDNWQVFEEKVYLLDLDNLRSYSWGPFFTYMFNKDVKRFLKAWRYRPLLHQAFIRAFKDRGLL